MSRSRSRASLASAAILAMLSLDAFALVAPPLEFELPESGAASGPPPAAPEFDPVKVSRGQGPQPTDETCSSYTSSSGDGRGTIDLLPLTAEDESGPLGFRFRLLRGELPGGLDLPRYPLAPQPSGHIYFYFGDSKADRERPFEFTLSVTAVRSTGAESEPVEMVVAHDGSTDQSGIPRCEDGCSTTLGKRTHGAEFAVGLLALGLGWSILRRVRHARRAAGAR